MKKNLNKNEPRIAEQEAGKGKAFDLSWPLAILPTPGEDGNVGSKVFVAMSGGVDSSVAAYLLKKQGYSVTGVYMKNWSEESWKGKLKGPCPWRQDLNDVKKVCRRLAIPFKVYNFEKEYNDKVIDYFFRMEKSGKTPNPDIICNKEIKFGLFLKKALADGADFIATGHYARLRREFPISPPTPRLRRAGNFQFSNKSQIQNSKQKNLYQIHSAKDKNKDQTYFLCLLTQRQLSKTIFPLGDYEKKQVRKIAEMLQLPTAEKPESMGICFIGEMKMEDFLKTRIKERPGKIINTKGEVVGTHKGLPFYTIGQRQGLRVSAKTPYYVTKKDMAANTLIVVPSGNSEYLKTKTAKLDKINWIIQPPKLPLLCLARIRHQQPLQKVRVLKRGKSFIVRFSKKQRAVTPGQFCAFYKKGELLGGGVIK